MHFTTRVALLLLAALLTACAGRPSAPQPIVHVPVASIDRGAEDVLFRALGLVGTPYRYGGNTPAGGFDCSGLIGYVYRDAAGVSLPRSTRELISMRAPAVGRNALQSGDLVFFATRAGVRSAMLVSMSVTGASCMPPPAAAPCDWTASATATGNAPIWMPSASSVPSWRVIPDNG
jgi:cell wall-associated NlpC family hydrolase